MTDSIWEITKDALTPLGLPLAQNSYLVASGSQTPDAYLVYFLVSSPVLVYADNEEKVTMYRMQVSYYNRKGLASLPGIAAAMKAAGFTVGPKTELPRNQKTGHCGLALEYVYLDEEKNP